MTMHDDGTGNCDSCGVDIGNGGIDQAASVHMLQFDGSVVTMHVCYLTCAAKLLPSKNFPQGHRGEDQAPRMAWES